MRLTHPVPRNNHSQLVSGLKPGVITVFENAADEKSAKRFFVSSGSVLVNVDSTVQIISEEAVPVDDLDTNAVRAGLDAWTAKLGKGDDAAQAEAAIGVEVHEAMAKAISGEM